MSAATADPPRRWLLVSDIDDTLTGDGAALARFSDALDRYRDRLWFVVNSSRPTASVARTLEDVFPKRLIPDATITGMGTEISVGGAEMLRWQARFNGWPQEQVFRILSELGHRPHDSEFQTPRKVSFAVPGRAAQAEARQALAANDLACQIITSGTSDFDVIPMGAGKDAATLHLASELGIDLSRVVVAGDSGNDLAMFRAVRHRIAVGNARPELVDALPSGAYFQANRSHADGVLEGLVHFGVIPDSTAGRSS